MITTSMEARRPFAPVLAVFAVMMAVSGAAVAEATRLTPASVKQFIASFPAVKVIATRHATASGSKIGSGKEALIAVAEVASDKAIKGEVDAATRPHGFRDAKEWFGVAKSVASSYTHLKLSPDDEKNRRKLEKAIAKIEKNDFLSEKMKRKAIEAVRENLGKVTEAPPPENVDAVRPMVAAIDAMVK